MKDSESKDIASAIEVVAGNPTPEELAAVVAVLKESATATTSTRTETNWARGSHMLRGNSAHGDLQWRPDFKGEI
jgi:hypothetical protein